MAIGLGAGSELPETVFPLGKLTAVATPAWDLL